MEEITELIFKYGAASVILAIFLRQFIKMLDEKEKMADERNKEMLNKIEGLVTSLDNLYLNNNKMEALMVSLSDSVKQLSEATKTVASTIDRIDIYNRELARKVEKHDVSTNARVEKLHDKLDEINRRW